MFSSISNWHLIALSFIGYFLVGLFYKRLKNQNLEQALRKQNGVKWLNLKSVIGILLFGLIPFSQMVEFQFLVKEIEIPRMHLLLLILAILFLTALVSYKAVMKVRFTLPEKSNVQISQAWNYFILRFTFLFSYEFFFRGVLLFSFLKGRNLYLAILYTTLLYVLSHIFNSKKEIIGVIPFGILLGVLAYLTKSIWYVFFIHVALTAVYEITLFYNQTSKSQERTSIKN